MEYQEMERQWTINANFPTNDWNINSNDDARRSRQHDTTCQIWELEPSMKD